MRKNNSVSRVQKVVERFANDEILGRVYLYQDNPQMALTMDETAWKLVRRHRILVSRAES